MAGGPRTKRAQTQNRLSILYLADTTQVSTILSAVPMSTFNDLPNELIIEIIKEVVPNNPYEPMIGVNAAWNTVAAYHQSLQIRTPIEDDDNDDLSAPTAIYVSIYATLLSLRLTSSTLNELCLPFVFKSLNILKHLDTPFEEFYNLIVKPYAKYFRIVRICLGNFITDENAAAILNVATNASGVLLYHSDFISTAKPAVQSIVSVGPESGKQDKPLEMPDLDWMHHTTTAVLRLLADYSLQSLGIYSNRILNDDWWGDLPEINGPIKLLLQILQSPVACKSIKMLDIVLYSIPREIYDPLRQNLPSLMSLTVYHAFRPFLGRFWDEGQQMKWNLSHKLTRLYLKKCAIAYAPHIPILVRHVPSLRHLLISMCGYGDDIIIDGPRDKDWSSSSTALWKVRQPLDTFQFEYADVWEMGAMGEIPTKNLILANTAGSYFIGVVSEHPDYFPKLEVINIEPKEIRRYGRNQFTEGDFELLEKFCRKRGVSIARNAVPTSLWPSHFM